LSALKPPPQGTHYHPIRHRREKLNGRKPPFYSYPERHRNQ
jgi:hypothetical protein